MPINHLIVVYYVSPSNTVQQLLLYTRYNLKLMQLRMQHYEDLYTKLDSREGIKMVYKLAKTRDRRTKDISDMPFINSLEGQILTVGSDIILRPIQSTYSMKMRCSSN